jgi:hypothetical protein
MSQAISVVAWGSPANSGIATVLPERSRYCHCRKNDPGRSRNGGASPLTRKTPTAIGVTAAGRAFLYQGRGRRLHTVRTVPVDPAVSPCHSRRPDGFAFDRRAGIKLVCRDRYRLHEKLVENSNRTAKTAAAKMNNTINTTKLSCLLLSLSRIQ